MVAGVPMQACSYAANLSWNVVSKVSKSLISQQPSQTDSSTEPSTMNPNMKRQFVRSLLKAKEESSKTFAQIAEGLGVTNVYCAQLFHNQAQLRPETAVALKKEVPALTEEQIREMSKAPVRTYDQHVVQEPSISHLQEGILHHGESLKALINEECGDGVMSSVDLLMTLDKIKDPMNENRIIITLNGKFIPHSEQKVSDNVALIN